MVFFRDDKDDGDEGLKGEGQPLIRFSKPNKPEYKLPIAVLKKSFGFLIVRRAKNVKLRTYEKK